MIRGLPRSRGGPTTAGPEHAPLPAPAPPRAARMRGRVRGLQRLRQLPPPPADARLVHLGRARRLVDRGSRHRAGSTRSPAVLRRRAHDGNPRRRRADPMSARRPATHTDLLGEDMETTIHPRMRATTLAHVTVSGIAIVGLHIADDSFLQPEPGTSALGHLAGGLIPLAALAIAAAGYRCGRAGLRATIAIVVGILALVVGAASAGYETVTVGPSGDDFSGLLVLPAGLALIGLGIATLWTSRKLHDRRRRRYTRRTLIGVATVIGAATIIAPLGLSYVTTHVLRQSVPPANLGAAHENVTFRTSDGLDLQGWYVPSRNGSAGSVSPSAAS